MQVVMVSKALVVGAYQRKAEEIARLGIDLTLLVPPSWGDRRGWHQAEREHEDGYELRIIPIRFNGSYHTHYYPTLAHELDVLQPDILHMDEEPYNLATWLALRAAERRSIHPLFFTWQNIHRRYPPPFRWMEKANYRRANFAIAGNEDAAQILRRKGYGGKLAVIPQLGVDPAFFFPSKTPPDTSKMGAIRIGYAGGLLPEKGVDLLLHACAGLRGEWRLHIVGEGTEQQLLQELAEELGIGKRVKIDRRLPSAQMPDYYRALDVLVLPSRTTASWKEQFGRVLVEAMASEVVVVGSDCGEIPIVVGEAGLIFDEDDADALRRCLQCLLEQGDERQRLGRAGRRRVLEHFTMRHIAEQTVELYRIMMPSLARVGNRSRSGGMGKEV